MIWNYLNRSTILINQDKVSFYILSVTLWSTRQHSLPIAPSPRPTPCAVHPEQATLVAMSTTGDWPRQRSRRPWSSTTGWGPGWRLDQPINHQQLTWWSYSGMMSWLVWPRDMQISAGLVMTALTVGECLGLRLARIFTEQRTTSMKHHSGDKW